MNRFPKVLGVGMLVLFACGLMVGAPSSYTYVEIHKSVTNYTNLINKEFLVQGIFALLLLIFFVKLNTSSKKFSSAATTGIAASLVQIIYFAISVYLINTDHINQLIRHYLSYTYGLIGYIGDALLIIATGVIIYVMGRESKLIKISSILLFIACLMALDISHMWPWSDSGYLSWNGYWTLYHDGGENIENYYKWLYKLSLIQLYVPMTAWGLYLLLFRYKKPEVNLPEPDVTQIQENN